MICTAVGLAVPALAAAAPETYTINSTLDEPDSTPGNEICLTAANKCTLRAAIQESNADGGEDEIVFGPTFNGELADTIDLGSALPAIEVPTVTIDGESSAACATAAGPTGPCAGVNGPTGAPTFEVEAVHVTIKGLSLTGATVGVKATVDGEFLTVAGNWIGTKLDGTAAADTTGIDVVGTTTLEGNKISGGEVGIHTGGNDAGGSNIERNLISGTLGSGILIENDNNLVLGNQVSGAGAAGVRVHSAAGLIADENTIGGSTLDPSAPDPDENVIDGSAGAAIEINTVQSALANRVLRNSGSGNTGAFIKLVKAEPSQTKGPNNGIQPPHILAVTSTEVSGTAAPEAAVRLFHKTSAEPGELSSFLGIATANSNGEWSIALQPPLPGGASKAIFAASQTPEEEERGSSELATVTAELAQLKVQKAGTGSGEITGALGQISCGATCEAFYFGLLRLTGTPVASSNPVVWSGCDAVVGSNECEVTMSAARQVTATFDLTPTCAIDPSLCPPSSGGPSDSGGSSSSGGPSQPQPKSSPTPKPLKCKAGFKKKKVKGALRCVKTPKPHRKHR